MNASFVTWIFLSCFSIAVASSANDCDCNNVKCTRQDECENGRVLDHCGCCFVCVKIAGELCGGDNETFGKCKDGLQCFVERTNLTNSFGVGICTKLQDRNSSEETGCDHQVRRYLDKKNHHLGVHHCYEDVCGTLTRVTVIKRNCLDIGCGVTMSLRSSCCRLCTPEKVRVHCSSEIMQVVVPKSLMPKRVFLGSSLNEKKCTGIESSNNYIFETSIYGCRTNMQRQNKTSYMFSNQINTSVKRGLDTIHRTFFNFFCKFERKTTATAILRIRQKLTVSGGTGVRLRFTTGGRLLASRHKKVGNRQKRLDVSISSVLAKRFKLRIAINSCYLSSSKVVTRRNGGEHFFISKGCIVDNRIKLIFKRGDAIWFSILTNDNFNKLKGRMYLHCDVIICSKRSVSVKCNRKCNKKNADMSKNDS